MNFALRRPTIELSPRQHLALSSATATVIAAAALGAIQIFGDPDAAAPSRVVPLDGLSTTARAAYRAPLSDVVIDPSISEDAGALDPALAYAFDPMSAGAPGAFDAPPAPTVRPRTPLIKAPLAKLTAPGPKGPLPVIAADGTLPWRAYRRPYTGDPTKPRVGIIVGGLGFNARVTQAAIDELPPEITLSFVPYADNLQGLINQARAQGHEVLIELPMEPFDPEATDTGPQTLLTGASAKDNIARLENLLSRAAGYVGVSNYQGAKFVMSSAASAPVVKALKDRGLSFMSNGVGQRAAFSVEAQRAGLPFTAADRVLDAQREAEAIDDQLLNLEALAQSSGAALGAGFAYPVTIEQIKIWSERLEDRGIALAPASAVMEARAPQR